MIRVTQQPAILAWNTKQAALEQSGNGKNTLDIQTVKPQIQIRTTKPEIKIDQSQSFAEAGIKGFWDFMKDTEGFTQQMLQRGIDRIVSDGNEWLDIHTGRDPIPDQAVYNAFEMFDKQFNYGVIPTSRPKMDLQRGDVKIDYQKGKVVNNTVPTKIQMQYSPWRIDYYMKQYASIQFRYEPSTFSKTV